MSFTAINVSTRHSEPEFWSIPESTESEKSPLHGRRVLLKCRRGQEPREGIKRTAYKGDCSMEYWYVEVHRY